MQEHNIYRIILSIFLLVYFWKDENSVEMNPDVSLAEFYVLGYKQRRVLEILTSGNYSRLCMDIMFTRSMGYYLIQVPKSSIFGSKIPTLLSGLYSFKFDCGDVLGKFLS